MVDLKVGTRRSSLLVAAAVTLALTGCAGAPAPSSTPPSQSAGPSSSQQPSPVSVAPSTPAATSPGVEATASPSSDTVQHPCKLMTRAEAQKLVGSKLKPGVEVERYSCAYDDAGSPGLAVGTVGIYVGPGATAFLSPEKQVRVADLGDEGYRIFAGSNFDVVFRKGAIWVAIHVVRNLGKAPTAKAFVTLARKVATRL